MLIHANDGREIVHIFLPVKHPCRHIKPAAPLRVVLAHAQKRQLNIVYRDADPSADVFKFRLGFIDGKQDCFNDLADLLPGEQPGVFRYDLACDGGRIPAHFRNAAIRDKKPDLLIIPGQGNAGLAADKGLRTEGGGHACHRADIVQDIGVVSRRAGDIGLRQLHIAYAHRPKDLPAERARLLKGKRWAFALRRVFRQHSGRAVIEPPEIIVGRILQGTRQASVVLRGAAHAQILFSGRYAQFVNPFLDDRLPVRIAFFMEEHGAVRNDGFIVRRRRSRPVFLFQAPDLFFRFLGRHHLLRLYGAVGNLLFVKQNGRLDIGFRHHMGAGIIGHSRLPVHEMVKERRGRFLGKALRPHSDDGHGMFGGGDGRVDADGQFPVRPAPFFCQPLRDAVSFGRGLFFGGGLGILRLFQHLLHILLHHDRLLGRGLAARKEQGGRQHRSHKGDCSFHFAAHGTSLSF